MPTPQQQKNENFRQLHYDGLLVLPNIWNPIGAAILEQIGYPAVATGSGAVANANGYPDGEVYPFDELLKLLKNIVDNVDIPVTADVERCYADDKNTLQSHVKMLLDTGISGINYEDSRHGRPGLMDKNEQAEAIHLIRQTADAMGHKLFINARSDAYIKKHDWSVEQKLAESIERANLYREAGADGFYPIVLSDRESIATLVHEVNLPVNILMHAGIPDFEELRKIGVARLSLGSGFFKMVLSTMKDVAEKLFKSQGMADVIGNSLSEEWMNPLIKRH